MTDAGLSVPDLERAQALSIQNKWYACALVVSLTIISATFRVIATFNACLRCEKKICAVASMVASRLVNS